MNRLLNLIEWLGRLPTWVLIGAVWTVACGACIFLALRSLR